MERIRSDNKITIDSMSNEVPLDKYIRSVQWLAKCELKFIKTSFRAGSDRARKVFLNFRNRNIMYLH